MSRAAVLLVILPLLAGCFAPNTPLDTAHGGAPDRLRIVLMPPREPRDMAVPTNWDAIAQVRIGPGPVTLEATWDDSLDTAPRRLSATDHGGPKPESLGRISSGSPVRLTFNLTHYADVSIGLYKPTSAETQSYAILDTAVTFDIVGMDLERAH